MNPYGLPEINVEEVARRRAAGDAFILVDVREPHEIAAVNLGAGVELVPMSEIAALRLDALPAALDDRNAEVVVICHHGTRSLQVSAWLRQQGWNNVLNMTGGVEAWAQRVDPTIGRY